jgi:hypothetical protein
MLQWGIFFIPAIFDIPNTLGIEWIISELGDLYMNDRLYVEIPGDKTHELPPLFLHGIPECKVDLVSVLTEAEDMVSSRKENDPTLENRRFELALQLTEQYKGLLAQWVLGDSVVEWIRQCEITFESEGVLRKLLRPDIWPHTNRASFVELLQEKAIPTGNIVLPNAVGLRLAFRQPPPIDCFSSDFLFYLNSTVANTAYRTWSHVSTLFPPDRFHFDVIDVS